MEQVEVEKAGLQRRIRDKDKRLAGLEGRIADLEEEKLAQFREYQEELEAQKNILELQAVELKKRMQELTEKSDSYRQQLIKQQQLNEQLTNSQQLKEQQQQPQTTQSKNMSPSINEKQLQAQIKQLQDKLIEKEEENYVTIVNLKEENSKLVK